jgi:large subunit ribosomal protein L13
MTDNEIILDATNSALGRLASFAAKQALLGNKIIIVNSEKAIILGNQKDIIKDFIKKGQRGGVKGPFHPSKSEGVLKRAIRGMLSYKKGRGSDAFKRIFCYRGVPEKYAESKKLNIAVKKTIECLTLSKLETK